MKNIQADWYTGICFSNPESGFREQQRAIKAQLVADAVARLQDEGIPFEITNKGTTLLLRQEGKPKIDYWPGVAKWKICGAYDRYRNGSLDMLVKLWHQATAISQDQRNDMVER